VRTESRADRSRISARFEGWQGILLVASTYVYFLIFAQFGFLKRLAELGLTDNSLLVVMGAMAIGGIAISLLAPRILIFECPSCRVQTGLIGCGFTALWTLLPLNLITVIGVAFGIGVSLGLLTVTLVANLGCWIGTQRPLLKIGLGTGIGYFLCNFPPLFTATPRIIALSAAGCCLVTLVVVNRSDMLSPPDFVIGDAKPVAALGKPVPFSIVLTWFTALVWLDSAAFYIIQNSPLLKAGTWQGDLHLWRAGGVHLAAALLSAWLLARRGIITTLALALIALAAACLLLLDPSHVMIAAIIYPIGVSLYSVALVAYPSFLMPLVSQATRARRAGYLYALAGWVGSAMGIGMGRNLHHVPPAFVAATTALFALPWIVAKIKGRKDIRAIRQQGLTVVVVLTASIGLHRYLQRTTVVSGNVGPPPTAIERGRRVYIAEGCINCHSQYVRPNTADVLMWGPVGDLETIRRQIPPLIGNRRQGPDLSQVGARRSLLWLRIHFMNPRDVSYQSIMPRFDYLFRDSRGDDLIAYLASLNSPGHWSQAVADWRPSPISSSLNRAESGQQLFMQHCATCHLTGGVARSKWSPNFKRLPPNLFLDPFQRISPETSDGQLRLDLARIIKFGIQRTDMAGHEYLPDDQIVGMTDYILKMREQNGLIGK
jgi:cytochrome c oxidase cbb3-type subunit 2